MKIRTRAFATRALCTLLLCILSTPAWANLASPFPVEVEQPDGTPIVLYIRGNEHLNWYEYVPEVRVVNRAFLDAPESVTIGKTPGYTVVRDDDGRYVFAAIGDDGDLAPSEEVVGTDEPPAELRRRLLPVQRRIEAAAQARMPGMHDAPQRVSPAGDVQNLVILMRFRDHRQRQLPTAADFNVIFNAPGGDPALAPTGSIFDVYEENSYGQLKLRSKVVGWVDLPKTEAQYAAGQSGLTTAIQQAIRDALDAVVSGNLVDFAKFDNENGGTGDGRIDAITFVHSGYAAEFGGVDSSGADYKDRIWSHRWSIPTWSANPAGVKVSDYNINPGLWSISGNQPGRIGVICHELGHFFGLPDLYDYSQQGEGAGSWCLMANSWGFDGSQHHPPHLSAWSKIFLGWNSSIALNSFGTYQVKATALPGAEIYRVNYPGGSASEYLLIENRQPVGNYEGAIAPGSDGVRGGLAIWHIDDNKIENDDPGYPGQSGWPGNGRRYRVALLQADGAYHLEKGFNRGDGDDLFRGGFRDELTATSLPSSSSYDGISVPEITLISTSADTMSFTYGPADSGGGDGGDQDDGKGGCCPVMANAVVQFGTTIEGTAKIASVTIALPEDSVVHLVANGSVRSDQNFPATITNGFFDQDVPSDVSEDEMWFSSLRFVTLPENQWTNFGSTAAIALPKGNHTIYWKVWVDSATLEFDSGTLLVEAVTQQANTSGIAPAAQQDAGGRSVKASERSDAASKEKAQSAPASTCSPEIFDALLSLIANAEDDPQLRQQAIGSAVFLADKDQDRCKGLATALSKIISDPDDDRDVRLAAIKAAERLKSPM